MSGDATTLPLRDIPIDDDAKARSGRGLWRRRSDALTHADSTPPRLGALALLAVVALSLLVVAMAANRPSLLTPTTHANFFPHWMAGPLGGLLPGMTGNSTTLKYWFSAAMVLMYVGYLVALRYAPRLPLRWVIGAILAVHAIFFLSPPLALTDIFNYINYGRMEAVHHLNPYTTIPIMEPHDDPSFVLSNWHQLLSPYGPLFTMLTFVVVPLGVVGSFWALKGILALASLATIYLVWRCARLLGRDPVTAIALVGLNPVVLVWGLGGDHNDFLMVFCLVLGLYLLLRARAAAMVKASTPAAAAAAASTAATKDEDGLVGLRGWLLPFSLLEVGAGAAFVVAASIKASGAVLIPVVLIALLRTPRRLVQVLLGMALTVAVVGSASLLAFGLHVPDLSTQSRLITSESIPNLLGLAVGAGGESDTIHHLMSAALVASVGLCCWLAWRRRASPEGENPSTQAADRLLTASGWASVALLVTLSWVLPWYVLWVLPLTALSRSRRLRGAALAIGVYLIIAWAPASGLLWKAIGFHPEKTALGRLHQRAVRELLN